MFKSVTLLFGFLLPLSIYAYDCSNSEVRITVKGSSSLNYVSELRSNPKKVFDNDYVYTIYEQGEQPRSFSIIAATTDGAGQDAFDVFKLDSDLSPVEKVAGFYFEHEGGCLEGSYFSFKKGKWVDISPCWGASKERIMCKEY